MKTAVSGALATYLNDLCTAAAGAQLLIADLFTFTAVDGTVFRLTSWPESIVIGGNTFSALGPFLERTRIKHSLGFEVVELEVTITADPSHAAFSRPFLQALAYGDFDGATVLIERLFMPAVNDVSLGTAILFKGFVADVAEVSRVAAQIKVRSRNELLNEPMPRNLYQPACRHTLFDAGCALDPAAFRVSGSVTTGSTVIDVHTGLTQPSGLNPPVAAPSLTVSTPGAGVNLPAVGYYAFVTYMSAVGETSASPEATVNAGVNQVVTVHSPPSVTGATGYNVYVGTGPGQEQKQNSSPVTIGSNWLEPNDGLVQGPPAPLVPSDGYFTQGVITFTSGANNGLSRKIDGYEGGIITVMPGLPSAPLNGDMFTALPGCTKDMARCDTVFANLIHFGGMPFLPTPEASI